MAELKPQLRGKGLGPSTEGKGGLRRGAEDHQGALPADLLSPGAPEKLPGFT